ncbi:hypothetical protein OSB04_015411 [Centaurea solstitialis]|uniref:DUF4218 domain-containing protein n=1 Tax=Centaurea solstitialis TaxID=347529 RepID=A0AA38TA48_9ASTR|nr:hypothetical protein OSB04_015411 [Centaurea solstitialis]
MNDKSKDTTNARIDLENLKIRKPLWLQKRGIKLPDGFRSNISKKVTDNDTNIAGLKSHDCHILMQRLIPIGVRGFSAKDKSTPIVELCNIFKQLCSRTLMARPEGSIAEGYVAEEALTFCSMYLQDVQTRFNRPKRNEDVAREGALMPKMRVGFWKDDVATDVTVGMKGTVKDGKIRPSSFMETGTPLPPVHTIVGDRSIQWRKQISHSKLFSHRSLLSLMAENVTCRKCGLTMELESFLVHDQTCIGGQVKPIPPPPPFRPLVQVRDFLRNHLPRRTHVTPVPPPPPPPPFRPFVRGDFFTTLIRRGVNGFRRLNGLNGEGFRTEW